MEELRNFQAYCVENGPAGPNRRVIMAEFCLKAIAEASEFFFRNISNELYLQRSIAEETLKKLQQEIKEMKDEQRSKNDFYENKLRNVETEKAEISAKEQSVKENLTQIIKEREQFENEMKERIDTMKKDFHRQLEESRNKVSQTEEQQKEIHRQRMAAESEFDKQKALLEQKLEFFEKSLEEA